MQTSVTDPGLAPDLAPGLMRLASRLAGSSDAEDLVQSTWVRALEHRGPVRDRRPWLRRVMVNEQRMQLRGRKRRDEREQAQHELREVPADVDELVHCLEVARIVDGLLDELDEDLQLVVRERYFGGSSAAEIARRHQIPAGTVRWRLKSGLDRLRTQLDSRYGGRRALWAGGFMPVAVQPTLCSSAASQASTAGGTLTAAGKGLSAMSVKILMAAGLVATAGGVAWVASADSEPVSVAATESAEVEPSAAPDSTVAAAVAPEATLSRATPEAVDKRARWAKRRAAIQAAQAASAADPAPAEGMTWHAAGADDAQELPEGEHGFCAHNENCFGQLAQEVMGLVDGCQEFMDGIDPSVTLNAHVIGAPDIGTIVDSVELSSHDGASEELLECLTESMYAMDLGATEQNIDAPMTLSLSSASDGLGALAGAEVDAETRAALEEALAHAKENGEEVSFMFGGDSEGLKGGELDEQARAALAEALAHAKENGGQVRVLHLGEDTGSERRKKTSDGE
ncbi:MAG: RNA polymerase sigma factor [Myxococcota bacterium]